VPRTAFLPSWVTAPHIGPDGGRSSTFAERLTTAAADVREVTRRLEALAPGLQAVLDDSVHARHLRPASGWPGVAVYRLFGDERGGRDAPVSPAAG
jgi:hypothetical protein